MNKLPTLFAMLIITSLFAMPLSAHAARTLTLGSVGQDVLELQRMLNKDADTRVAARGAGSPGNETTRFGPATRAAVQKFQVKYGIAKSGQAGYGLVGPKTQAKLAALFGGSGGSSVSVTPLNFEFSGWIPYWKKNEGVLETIAHIDTFKEINPFGYVVNSEGIVNDSAVMMESPWPALTAAAKAKKVRVMPTVMWGDGDSIHNVLSNPTLRNEHIQYIVNIVNDNGFDGVDIDYEAKKAETNPYFTIFLRDLYKAMGKKWVSCTIESRTPVEDRFSVVPADLEFSNDFKAINKYCDRVKIMAYDQGSIDLKLNTKNKAEGGPYVPVADVEWVEKTIRLAMKDIDKKKIVIGVPTYGYEYEVTPTAKGYIYDRQWAFNPRWALDIAVKNNVTPVRNAAGELSFMYQPKQNEVPPAADQNPAGSLLPTAEAAAPTSIRLLWWSDAEAIRQKVELAKKLGVRGVAVFKIDGGYDPNLWNVLK